MFLAVCFKNAKQYEQAKDAYLKEAEYHTENKAYPLCALSLHTDLWQDITVVLSLFYHFLNFPFRLFHAAK